MILADAGLEDVERAVQVLEALGEVATVVIIHGQSNVTVADIGMVDAEKSLLQYDGLSLKLNSLQEISKLELDAGDVSDACCDFFIHGTRDLEEHVDGLRVKLKGSVELVLFVGHVGLSEAGANVGVISLDLLHIGEKLSNVLSLEWQVLVVSQDVLFGQGSNLWLSLSVLLLVSISLLLD